MRVMSTGVLVALLAACGPTAHPQGIKSADDFIDEQEQLGAKDLQAQQQASAAASAPEATEDEKRRQWDEYQVELELKRASRSAETCPESVADKKSPQGRVVVTLTFNTEGRVKSTSLGAPFEGTAVGNCVTRAMEAVIVPAYKGDEQTVRWEVDLTGKKQSGMAK